MTDDARRALLAARFTESQIRTLSTVVRCMTLAEYGAELRERAEWQVRAAESTALRAEVERLHSRLLEEMEEHRETLSKVVLERAAATVRQ